MKGIITNRLFLIGGFVVSLIIVLVVSLYIGNYYALKHLTIISATPNQLASAMQQDDFYSTYRENTLIVKGVVSSANRQSNHTFLVLKTSVPYSVSCDTSGTDNSLKPGDTIKILANAYIAERTPSGILLHDCVLL